MRRSADGAQPGGSLHRGVARRYDYGPTRTCGWSRLEVEAIFAGRRYQRSLEQ